jgi:hypothetical protein
MAVRAGVLKQQNRCALKILKVIPEGSLVT